MTKQPLRPIAEIAALLGLGEDEFETYGRFKAKVDPGALARRKDTPDGRVVLVTAINPTPAGEGKTVTAIALAQGMRRLGVRSLVCLREPSLGPVFGMKGGATGGGLCTVEPSLDINLHFTGDFHAVTAAHNLLAAMTDNHLYRRREPELDPRRIVFPRALDMNDRSLRQIVQGLSGPGVDGGVVRQSSFVITAASEVMAVLGLATDYGDLRRRLERIVVGTTRKREPVTARDVGASGAMAALLRDAFKPNLVQTREGVPALVHTGPFGNIAHGTSSLISLLLGRKLADVVVVEAGFGADLGAEKFIHLAGYHGAPHPDAAVVVATVRALKYHGGTPLAELERPDPGAVERGLANLEHHVNIVRRLGMRPVVAINRFPTDTDQELEVIRGAARSWGARAAVNTGFAEGGAGAAALAEAVLSTVDEAGRPARSAGETRPGVYQPDTPLEEKIRRVASEIYGAGDVDISAEAHRELKRLQDAGYGHLPVCIAKTQYSLSDDPKLLGRPRGFTVRVREVALRAGAGYVLVLMGDIQTMPGLPAVPNAVHIDLTPEGEIVGVE